MRKGARKPIAAFGRLDIELTERCNNNCLHCYINLPATDRSARGQELPTRAWKRVLGEAVGLGYLSVRFTGGEPLLRDDFEELYLFARKAGLRVSIFTNATLVTQRLAQLLARIPPLDPVEVTMYGMEAGSYEATTGVKGSFAAAAAGIRLLRENKVPFVIKGSFLPGNGKDRKHFPSWIASMPGVQGRVTESSFYLRCRRDDSGRNRVIENLRRQAKPRLRLSSAMKGRYREILKKFCRTFLRPPDERLFDCGCGCGGCVDSRGAFQPCMLLRHPACVFDLRTGSLEDAVARFVPRVRNMKAADPGYLRRCARCFLKGLCEQCPANSWMEHGTLDTPVEHCCETAHEQGRFMGLLRKGEKAWEVVDWRQRMRGFLSEGE